MKISLIIGPTDYGTARFRTVLKKKSALLAKHKVFSPDWNHIRIYMACSSNSEVGLVRHLRGFEMLAAQQALYSHLQSQIAASLEGEKPDHLVISSGQLGALMHKKSELERLRAFFAPFSDDIQIHAYVDEQSRALVQNYEKTVMDGRRHPLSHELELTKADSWWDAALAMRTPPNPLTAEYNDIHFPPFWVDYMGLLTHWEEVFGAGNVHMRSLNMERLGSEDGAAELNAILGTDIPMGQIEAVEPDKSPSAETLERARQLNDIFVRYMQAKELSMPFEMRKKLIYPHRVRGPVIEAGALFPVAERFKADNAALTKRFDTLEDGWFTPPKATELWTPAPMTGGWRATQYMASSTHFIRKQAPTFEDIKALTTEQEDSAARLSEFVPVDAELEEKHQSGTSDKRGEFLEMFKVNHQIVMSTHIRPHNDMGKVREEAEQPQYSEVPMRKLPKGNTGNVIVGCMKNESPYILEWVAYHRAMGVDNFLIYTNGCEDNTTELLDHLQKMGVLQHRDNNKWKGKSPQQFALNKAQKEPVIQNAEWIIHIDVDEFINVRTGNGTLEDLFKATKGATNIAMTWRLFGHNDVHKLSDDFVIEQFDTCAPKYCPKPHTVWGFKSMFKNLDAYRKISCHRPNQVIDEKRDQLKWVNGSGDDVTGDYIKGGWRSSKKTIGYDLVQLNHYALRSAESFLIKRQRGRALHVDRSIGLNYWIRMDWSDHRDITIQRNLARTRAEYARLISDETLRKLHEEGLAWHKAKVQDLHQTQEFQELYAQALKVKLNETERVAYSLALDMES
ncbi:glycosyltransferase family 2 protein [Lentibacter sp.]|uniref:glycosyltransferase family 2 protein n=1 Tax=Lentibacter sp. TaxID=2024994 RepID=UPI003F6D076A